VRSEYERVVRHRNSLLRGGMRGSDDATTLEVWDDQLARSGAELVRARFALIARLGPAAAHAYDLLASRPAAVTAEYEAEWLADADRPLDGSAIERDAIERALRAALERLHKREVERGVTLAGPHRDEWRLRIDGFDARVQSSQGEQRSLALALRLAGHAVITDVVGEAPVLLLDDVFSELDASRTAALVAHLPIGQALITSAGVVPPGLHVDRTVAVHDGTLIEAAAA